MNSAELLKRDEILCELERLAQGQHPGQQTTLMRFSRCPDWQKAAELILAALDASFRVRRGARLPPPPGWLPPV
jgi:hypothetical protein